MMIPSGDIATMKIPYGNNDDFDDDDDGLCESHM